MKNLTTFDVLDREEVWTWGGTYTTFDENVVTGMPMPEKLEKHDNEP